MNSVLRVNLWSIQIIRLIMRNSWIIIQIVVILFAGVKREDINLFYKACAKQGKKLY